MKSSQPVTTAKKVAEGSAPTVVRMEEVVGDGEGVSDADDIDVEFPRLSEIKKAASMQFGVVPKKRGRPAKDKDDKPKAPLTKKPRGRPPTKINRSTENNSAHLVRTDQDEPSKPAANDLRSTSSRAKTIKPPRKVYNALITNEDLDTRRPSRAAAESAKSNITIQSVRKFPTSYILRLISSRPRSSSIELKTSQSTLRSLTLLGTRRVQPQLQLREEVALRKPSPSSQYLRLRSW